jgi:hypothetical protein
MLGNMSTDDPKPPQSEQTPPAPLTPPEQPSSTTTSAPPGVHVLSVAPEYLLGSPVSAQPPLVQTHQLDARNYAVHRLGSSHLTAADKAEMILAVAQWYVEEQAKTGTTILQTSPKTLRFVRELANKRGVEVKDSTLVRQVISPAFRSVKPKPAP